MRIVCTGRDSHPEVRFGVAAVTPEGRVYTEFKESRAEARDRLDDLPEYTGSMSRLVDKKAKTMHFRCPDCGLDYQRRGERWKEIVKNYHANDYMVLDLSKLRV